MPLATSSRVNTVPPQTFTTRPLSSLDPHHCLSGVAGICAFTLWFFFDGVVGRGLVSLLMIPRATICEKVESLASDVLNILRILFPVCDSRKACGSSAGVLQMNVDHLLSVVKQVKDVARI